jgi:hypothetical protein
MSLGRPVSFACAGFVSALLLVAGGACDGSAATAGAGAAGAGGPADAGSAGGSRGEDSLNQAGPPVNGSSQTTTGAGTPPGVYLTDENATAQPPSACATTKLGDFLAAIRAAEPSLADIRTIYDPATATSDGSFIYPYDAGVLGFDIVFKRGLGDCLAGCTENDYEYFASDASCQPVKVGHYHAGWGAGSCLTVEGTPMWTHPTPPDPLTVCGADNSPRDLRGTYFASASGQRTPCVAGATANPLDETVQLVIDQDPQDLSMGFVTFSNTGDPVVDGVPLPARFQRMRFDAALMKAYGPEACPREASVTARYDFEGFQPGGIEALDFGDDACNTCKGSLSASLGPTTVP